MSELLAAILAKALMLAVEALVAQIAGALIRSASRKRRPATVGVVAA